MLLVRRCLKLLHIERLLVTMLTHGTYGYDQLVGRQHALLPEWKLIEDLEVVEIRPPKAEKNVIKADGLYVGLGKECDKLKTFLGHWPSQSRSNHIRLHQRGFITLG